MGPSPLFISLFEGLPLTIHAFPLNRKQELFKVHGLELLPLIASKLINVPVREHIEGILFPEIDGFGFERGLFPMGSDGLLITLQFKQPVIVIIY